MPRVAKLDPKVHGENGQIVLDYRFVSPKWEDDRYYVVVENALAIENWAIRLKHDRQRCRTTDRNILVKIQKRSP